MAEKVKNPVENLVENPVAKTAEVPVKRGRGRPKGTGGNVRQDRSVNLSKGENTRYINHDLRLWNLPDVDMTNKQDVTQRITDYLTICAEDDFKPSIAGLALAFGTDRGTLWKWCNGWDSKYMPQEVRAALKKAYNFITAQMENFMQNGKINPVAGIFLMKNNMGYTDKQEVILTPNQQLGDAASAEELEQKYLQDVINVTGQVEDD